MKVSNEDLIVLSGGTPASGSRSHYPIWLDQNNVEYIYIGGQTPVVLSKQTNLKIIKRETVVRR